jgi:queuine/archaeosine tRNA-ribosyltransferase
MYSFVPAAVNYLDKHGIGIYIKYTKSGNDKIVVKEDNIRYTWIKTPDRELILVKNRDLIFHPMGENFDEYVDLNIYSEAVTSAIGTDIYMLNYTAYGADSDVSPCARRNGRNPNIEQPYILADSGGFQVYSGVRDYIDPKAVVEWYNENVDWGMVLDIPPIFFDAEYLDRSANIQKANIKVMLENKAPNVELINVIHGRTYDQRMEFLKKIDTPDIDRVAFGGYRGSVVSCTADALQIFSGKRKFKHYHILGVYNLLKLIPIIKMANTKMLKKTLITSDATTPIQSAVNKMYHHQQSIFEPAKRIPIGHKIAVYNPYTYLPCQCPVCSSIKYLNILGFLDGQLAASLISLHNIYEINRYTKMMEDLAKNADDKEYKTIVKHQLKSRASETLAALDLISAYIDNPDKALKKYSLYFTKTKGLFEGVPVAKTDKSKAKAEQTITAIAEAKGLFKRENLSCALNSDLAQDANLFVNKREEVSEEQTQDRYDKMLEKYEKVHGIKVNESLRSGKTQKDTRKKQLKRASKTK